tara:strand:- start:1660 stop:1965 length:306 start_codon:yes stop_codon:yes gene_type:complete
MPLLAVALDAVINHKTGAIQMNKQNQTQLDIATHEMNLYNCRDKRFEGDNYLIKACERLAHLHYMVRSDKDKQSVLNTINLLRIAQHFQYTEGYLHFKKVS